MFKTNPGNSSAVKFTSVCIESIGVTLPPEIISSNEIERRLAPTYERLRLPEGRLELMSGIAQRRLWAPGTPIRTPSIESGLTALQNSAIRPEDIGCLVHGSVCRDYLEPATACSVHAGLGLSPDCWVHDMSNACLGLLSGAVQIAGLIESGAIKAGIVVGTENSRSLLEATIASLNADESLTRQSIKPHFASLTIGSGSCAILLCHESLSQRNNRLQAAVARAECEHNDLCQSDTDQAGTQMQPLMQTDSEQLLHAGVGVGQRTFESLLSEGYSRDSFASTVCHQVGGTHRKMMLESIGMPEERDFSTFKWLGNTGSVALPTALAIALDHKAIAPGDTCALLGIGS
ncbi:MAG TPA: 3-oxoacyl-ACP synthase III, partial [Planctomycetaceae bacterium]|nr:3-oxoacyl-ACP synthase III [Planctomycetaceae bacterium]